MTVRVPAAISLLLLVGLASFWQTGRPRDLLAVSGSCSGERTLQTRGVLRLPAESEPPLPSDLLSPLSLPPDLVRDDQWANVERTLQEAVTNLSRTCASNVQRVEALRDWLSAQGCVGRVSVPIREGEGVRTVLMLTAYPALVPITIVFHSEHERPRSSRLLLSVSAMNDLTYLSLKREEP